jgi:hypothetical protein
MLLMPMRRVTSSPFEEYRRAVIISSAINPDFRLEPGNEKH